MHELTGLSQEIRGVTFPYRYMVAGGAVKTLQQATRLIKADVMHEWGSFTTDGSDGNGGRDYYAEYAGNPSVLRATYNSIGLTNPGMMYAERNVDTYKRRCEDAGLPSWLSISGNGVEDTLQLTKRAVATGVQVVTVNGACPNKKDQPILCDDPNAVDEFFDRIDDEVSDADTLIAWKVSCGMRRTALEHNRNRFRRSRAVHIMITGNTVPHCLLYLPDGSTAIATANGITRGGMAGPAIHAIALDHTAFMAEDLPEGKHVFGAGGAGNAKTAANFIRAKASIVQAQSAYRESGEDPDFIRDVNIDLIDQFKGILA